MSTDKALSSLILPPAGYWQRKPSCVPRYNFGKGAKKDFSWYFKGQSQVRVKTVKEICKWLSKCKYMSDEALFMEEDFWQHPITFEHMRKGDCDDHALWAWRKLTEIGVAAELVCGKWIERRGVNVSETGHAWVNFRSSSGKTCYVLETTEKNPKKMILSLTEAEEKYFPEVSIDGNLTTYRFSIANKRRRA